MGDNFGPLDLIWLAVAVALLWKLRGVLGRRTGEERPHSDPYAAPEADAKRKDGEVLPFPKRGGLDQPREDAPVNTWKPEPAWKKLAPEGSPVAQGLTELSIADRNFNADQFMDGARAAYEMIVTAFAAGDRATLKPLLDPEVYRSFEQAITDREARRETIEQTFIGLTGTEITAVRLDQNQARITLKFVSELTSTTKNADGVVVAGDPVTIRHVTDIWTFERDISSRDPNWALSATSVGV